jgi:hypothetical protein
MENRCAMRPWPRTASVLIASVCASPGAAQVCSTAVVPPESVLIEIMQGIIFIGGERCTSPGEPCETAINGAPVTGA